MNGSYAAINNRPKLVSKKFASKQITFIVVLKAILRSFKISSDRERVEELARIKVDKLKWVLGG